MLSEPVICCEYTSIPNHNLASTSDFYPLSRIGGPDHSMPETFYSASGDEIFSSKSISTYPYLKGRHRDPISDRFYCSFYEKQALFALADGGGNGPASVDSAERAIIGLVEHMTIVLGKCKTTREIAQGLQRSFAAAHKKVMQSKSEAISTVQLFAGMLVELQDRKDRAFIGCSVGQIKAFYISKKEKKVIDLTKNNYLHKLKKNERAKGRLGPAINNAEPDVSTMELYFYLLDEDDFLLLSTDGIHLNYHPQQLSKKPNDIGIDLPHWSSLSSSSSDSQKQSLNDFICSELQKSIFVNLPNYHIRTSEIIDNLMNYSYQITEANRNLFASGISEDKFPRRSPILDHSTAIILRSASMLSSQNLPSISPHLGIVTDKKFEWKWQVFIPQSSSNQLNVFQFNIFSFLTEFNPGITQLLEQTEAQEIEDCFLDASNLDVELRQVAPLSIEVRTRTQAKYLVRTEKWEKAGRINLDAVNKGINKKLITRALSNILRHKSFDARKITEVLDKVNKLNANTDIHVVRGHRTALAVENCKNGGEIVAIQSDVEIFPFASEERKFYRVIEIHAQKESYLYPIVDALEKELKVDWEICSYSEFIIPQSKSNLI